MQVKDRGKNDQVLVLGHRGIPTKEIENTLESFSHALASGADGIELDVHITKDNRLVVIHDFNTKRVFGIDKSIEDSTLGELKEISSSIPTLDEVFDNIGHVFYDIEIKADMSYNRKLIPLLLQVLDKYQALNDRILVSSFNPFAMRRFSKLSKHRFPQGIIYDTTQSVPMVLHHGEGRLLFPCDFLKPKYDIAENEKKSKEKYPIVPWTVDTKESLDKMIALKAPIVISNTPDSIVRFLQEDGLR